MLVRRIWHNCNCRNKSWDADPCDAFWVEATRDEAERVIFPRLSEEGIAESKLCLVRSRFFIESSIDRGEEVHPYCFLVARDLSSVDPFHVTYPFDNLWSGYSPFEAFPETRIDTLEQLKSLSLIRESDATRTDLDFPAGAPLSEDLRQFIADESWTFAKTYAETYPHEYIVEERVDRDLFLRLAHHIDSYGYTDYFYNKAVIYLDYNGYTYWHMGIIINRCVEADTYHRRKRDGRLPKSAVGGRQ
jgi:hypothetical protein